MQILIAGNSQAGSLLAAHREPGSALSGHSVAFDTTPGATGPYLRVDADGCLGLALDDRQRHTLPEDAASAPIQNYDVIIISALGYVDGGFAFDNPITRRGKLHAFGPTAENRQAPVSLECYEQVVLDIMRDHYGFRLLAQLRDTFSGRVIVQPFPLLSEMIAHRSDWRIAVLYKEPVAMRRFLLDVQARCPAEACAVADAQLLDYPNASWKSTTFTPARLMSDVDGYHPSTEYGALVLRQIADLL